MQPKLTGHIGINYRRLKLLKFKLDKTKPEEPLLEPILGALLHLFRDFAEGDIPVGAGRSKGFGAIEVKPESIESTSAGRSEIFKQALVSIFAGKAMHGELKESVDGWLDALDNNCPSKPAALASAPKVSEPVADPWGAISKLQRSQQKLDPRIFTVQKGSYNPYHWVPAEPAPHSLLAPVKTLHLSDMHRHDMYARDGICGEIDVTIRPHTPIFVGGQRKSEAKLNGPAVVEHFKINGKDAIPSTSLRGLLSSTYEIATASAMRALEAETIYSYRMALGDESPDKPFDFIGKVKEQDGKLVIVPWARRPASKTKTGQQIAAKTIPGITTQPPTWVPTKYADIGPLDTLPNAYRLLSKGRELPGSRLNEIRFSGAPNEQDEVLSIGSDVLDRFHRIADDRTDATKGNVEILVQPYSPLDQQRGGKEKKYRVKKDDFIYFDTQDGKTVSRIALAQIWRDDVRKPLSQLFKDKNLSPFSVDRGRPAGVRTDLTMVETAFGVVLQARGEKKPDNAELNFPVSAFASKIVVTDAHLVNSSGETVDPGVPEPELLKVLSAPKPPSPAYYFDPVFILGTNRLASFQEIRNGDVRPRGRKMYLHLDWDKNKSTRPWKSVAPRPGSDHDKKLGDQRKMQVEVRCLGVENRFTFTIKFDNLSQDEFFALCYTLRPTPAFRHKLGMAKPLGLGSISFDVSAIRRIDRGSRYTSIGFNTNRFSLVPDLTANANEWIDACSSAWRIKNQKALKRSFDAFETIGTTAVETMQYPMTREQLQVEPIDREWELFKWPSENRKNAVNKHGGDMAHTMLPIAAFPQGIDGDNTFSIPRTPSPCYVLVIKSKEIDGIDQFKEFTKDAIEPPSLVTKEKVAEKIKTLPSDAVVYIISLGNAGVIHYSGRCGKRVELKSTIGPREDENERNDKGNKKLLDLLRKALALGARLSGPIQ